MSLRNRSVICINPRNLHAGRQAKDLRDARSPGSPDVFPGDDKDRSGCLQYLLRVPGNSSDLNIAELF